MDRIEANANTAHAWACAVRDIEGALGEIELRRHWLALNPEPDPRSLAYLHRGLSYEYRSYLSALRREYDFRTIYHLRTGTFPNGQA